MLALAALALTGCGGASSSPGGSPSPDDADAEVYRDSIDTLDDEWGTEALLERLDDADGEEIALDLTLRHRGQAGGSGAGEPGWSRIVVATPGSPEPGYLNLVLPDEAMAAGDDGWIRVRGVVTVDRAEDSADYRLTPVDQLDEAPDDDEKRCTADDLESDFGQAVAAVGESDYHAQREQWADAPHVWWAVKQTAVEQSGGRAAEPPREGDPLDQACRSYWSAG